MKWILILVAYNFMHVSGGTVDGDGRGWSVAMGEFNGKDACTWAANQAQAMSVGIKARCVPKGVEK